MIRSTSRADEARGSVLNAGALHERLLKRKGNKMNFVNESVVAKMNPTRLKAYRIAVIAHIDKTFTEYTIFRDKKGGEPINRDTQEYKDACKYLSMVNSYYRPTNESAFGA